MEVERKRKKQVEDGKRVHYWVGVGVGWQVVEGKAIMMVEITTHFATPLTGVEMKSLPEKMGMVSNPVTVKRKAKRLGMSNNE